MMVYSDTNCRLPRTAPSIIGSENASCAPSDTEDLSGGISRSSRYAINQLTTSSSPSIGRHNCLATSAKPSRCLAVASITVVRRLIQKRFEFIDLQTGLVVRQIGSARVLTQPLPLSGLHFEQLSHGGGECRRVGGPDRDSAVMS